MMHPVRRYRVWKLRRGLARIVLAANGGAVALRILRDAAEGATEHAPAS